MSQNIPYTVVPYGVNCHYANALNF